MVKKRIIIQLDEEVIQWLKKQAFKMNVSISELIRRSIEDYKNKK